VSDKWLVLKFGGSSVRGLEQWRSICDRVAEGRAGGYRLLLVCSALEGITDLLHDISRAPADDELHACFVDRHRTCATALEVDAREWIEKAADQCDSLRSELAAKPSPAVVAKLLALGEWLSTRIGWAFLKRHCEIDWMDARGLLEVVEDPERSERRQWLSADCQPGADAALREGLDGCADVVITQGYVAGMPGGGTALLGRGGSDTSAALLGGRIGAERVEIWTDVPGLFTADPREVPHARLLRQLDYAEALEMAASGASVVHARCIRAAAATGTPLWIRDTAQPEIGGTHINGETTPEQAAKAVVCQRGMAVLLLQNIDPRQQVGFLAWVFAVIAARGISIDLVATSETTTTVALNLESNHLEAGDLAGLVEELRARCKIDLFQDCVCVNVVGRGVRTALARLDAAFANFEASPLLMVSQSANDLCLSLLVNRGDEKALLGAAHQALIPGKANELFGPSWLELQGSTGGAAVAGGRA
jgi:diaminopimelate decarboxylase/aspartate kinase